MENETTFDDLMKEFEFEVPGVAPELSEEEKAKQAAEAAAKAAEEEEAKKKQQSADDDEAKKAAEEEAAKKAEEEEAEAARLKAEEEAKKKAEQTPSGESGSFYKNLALKYVENGTWSNNLALEIDGEEVPLEEVEELDEETFFQLEEAVKAQREEERQGKFLEVDGLDERRKNLIEIVKEGGDLGKIFRDEKQVQEYLNPFAGLDLDDEDTQARVYYNALVNFNKLDPDAAKAVVASAKKDLTLDTKVKNFTDQYTARFDKFIEDKKAALIEEKKQEKQRLAEFKKSLTKEYKENFKLKDTLVRKLTSSAVNTVEDGYEIDAIYDQKMQDPAEAAEIILFLNDKEAYLQAKMQETKIKEQKKTRTVVKMMQSGKKPAAGAGAEATKTNVDSEFDFVVQQ